MQDACFDTIIISDLHLGSEISRAKEALDLVKHCVFRRLILLGDIFADLNFRRLKKEHWHFLSYIRKLSNPKRGVEVVWVEGNHDEGLSELMSHLVGIPVYQEYTWDYEGIRHVAVHGHQFDRFAINNVVLSRLGEFVFLKMQKLDRKKFFVRYIDRANSRWLRLSSKVSHGALNHAKQVKADRIFCGHTHFPMQAEKDGVAYYNSGCWVDARSTWISINEEGVKIHEYDSDGNKPPADHSHSGEEREEADTFASDILVPAGLSANAEYESTYR